MIVFVSGEISAAPPSISATSPQAVAPGQTTEVSIRGKNFNGAARLWTSFPAKAELAPKAKNNASQAVFRITPQEGARPGIHAIRVVTPRGVSPLRLFLIDDLPTVAESPQNKSRSQPQELSPPIAVDGRMDARSREFYTFSAKAGDTIAIEVVARRIGSALDPMFRLLDPSGREVTYSDDEPGLQGDARLCYTVPQTGQYTLVLRDIRFRGGGNYPYRLRIGDFPCLTVPYPMGVQRGTKTKLSFAGSHVANVAPMNLKVPADYPLDWMNVAAKQSGGASSGFATLAVSDAKEFWESEPNDAPKKATEVSLKGNINGRFAEPDDVDHYVFEAKKGQRVQFAAITRRQGSPADLYLRLLNTDGKQLATADDAGTRDAVLKQTFPADGEYILAVEDLHRRGGPRLAYRIVIEPIRTGFSLSASADRMNVPAGGAAAITVNADRRGYNGPIELVAENLPEGLSSVPTLIGAKQKSVVLTVRADRHVKSPQMTEMQIVGTAKIGKRTHRAVADIRGALKGQANNMPWPPRILARASAAAVAPEKPIRLSTASPEVVFGRHLSNTVKVLAERNKGWSGPIKLAVTPEKNGLPGGIKAAVKPIPKNKNEIAVTFSANNKAPLGEFTAVLKGTSKKGKQNVSAVVPGIRLKLQKPFGLQADAGDGKLAPGKSLTVQVTAQRNPAFDGPITLAADNLPKGLSAEKATIPAKENQAEVAIKASKNVKSGTSAKVTLNGTGKAGKAKFSASAPKVSLTVK